MLYNLNNQTINIQISKKDLFKISDGSQQDSRTREGPLNFQPETISTSIYFENAPIGIEKSATVKMTTFRTIKMKGGCSRPIISKPNIVQLYIYLLFQASRELNTIYFKQQFQLLKVAKLKIDVFCSDVFSDLGFLMFENLLDLKIVLGFGFNLFHFNFSLDLVIIVNCDCES